MPDTRISNATAADTRSSSWIRGRAYCPCCKKTREYLKDAAIDEPLLCPLCNVPTEDGCGDDDD
jgi:hypothetical protein